LRKQQEQGKHKGKKRQNDKTEDALQYNCTATGTVAVDLHYEVDL
jgi:hypothetical protein